MRTTPFSGSPILTAAVHFYVCLACAEAQFCFKSFASRSYQCGRKTRYGLEFWSLDLPSAQVNFLGRVPALIPEYLDLFVFSESDLEELPVLWYFPYYLEPRVVGELPQFRMLDYKVRVS